MATITGEAVVDEFAKPNTESCPSHNGHSIPLWSITAQEYMAMERFPEFSKRFENGLHCLTLKERFELLELADSCAHHISSDTILHDKVSLLAGGNIVHVAADVIVNTSNIFLTSGKGVNGAVHAWAGKYLLMECAQIGWCKVGDAKITHGYDLPAKYVIHTVGPKGEDKNRAEKLRSCYMSCLDLCLINNLKTIVFPCISTGQYSYPSVEAGNIALSTVRQWLLDHYNDIGRIIFVTKTVRDEEVYSTLMLKYFPLTTQ